MKKVNGFTLIELLVVIAIIAILAAILFPVFAKVREKARQTSCLSNEKQLGLAMIQYVEDHDETMPYGNQTSPGGWAGYIYPYVKSNAVFSCPDDTSGGGSSYAYNGNFAAFSWDSSNNTWPAAPATIATMTSPSKSVMLFEVVGNYWTPAYTISQEAASYNQVLSPEGYGTGGAWDPGGAGDSGTPGAGPLFYATGILRNSGQSAAAPSSNFAALTGRHTDGSNFEMADGHAKWLRGSAVSGGQDMQGVPWLVVTDGSCGYTGVAASVDCPDSTLGATFGLR